MKSLSFLILIALLSSCGPTPEERNATEISIRDGAQIDKLNEPIQNARIKSKYIRSSKYNYYEIIEVDGKEYLTSSKGGIIPLP